MTQSTSEPFRVLQSVCLGHREHRGSVVETCTLHKAGRQSPFTDGRFSPSRPTACPLRPASDAARRSMSSGLAELIPAAKFAQTHKPLGLGAEECWHNHPHQLPPAILSALETNDAAELESDDLCFLVVCHE
jgi:hypothetical protein